MLHMCMCMCMDMHMDMDMDMDMHMVNAAIPDPSHGKRGRVGGGCSLTGEGKPGLGVRSPARSNYSSPTSGLAHAS